MNAFFALVQYDLTVLLRSWIVRFWFLLTVVGGIMAVVVSKNYVDDSSFLMAWALMLYAGLGSLVVLVISTSAISQEFPYLGDALLSRGIAPTPYVLSKLASRAIAVIAMFLLIVAPTAFIVQSQALNNDMLAKGIVVALSYWVFMLTVLVFMGVAFSVFFSNTLLGLVVLGVIWYIGLGLLALIFSEGFTPQGVLGGLPLVLQGKALRSEVSTIISLGIIAIIVFPVVTVRVFSTRDL